MKNAKLIRNILIGLVFLFLLFISNAREILYQIELAKVRSAIPENSQAHGKTVAAADKNIPDLSIWSGKRAMDYIATQLTFGARSPGTPGHEKVIDFITSEMAKTSASTKLDKWDYTAPGGATHAMTNIIARFDPANPRRIIVGTHFDSIIHAYRDKKTPDAVMPGANNSASGVALLLETAHAIMESKKAPSVGIDFIFFDGEEGPIALGAGDNNWHAIGSPHFTKNIDQWYAANQLPEQGVIFDMVCYKNLKLYPERLSIETAGAEVQRFWDIGGKIAPSIFIPKRTAVISDDHNALAIKGIPSFLVIGFQYEPWFNTTEDTLDKCSGDTLDAVGRTLLQYIYSD